MFTMDDNLSATVRQERGPPRAMRTLGQHLATRLVEIGVTHVFGVPGAYWLLRHGAMR